MTFAFKQKKCEEFRTAAAEGDFYLVKSLSFDLEVDLNQENSSHRTAVHLACENGHVDVVRYLLEFRERTIQFNSQDIKGATPFLLACQKGRHRVAELLLGCSHIDVNKPDRRERSPLWWALHHRYPGVVKVLLAAERKVNVTERDVRPPPKGFHEPPLIPDDESKLLVESYLAAPQAVKFRLRREFRYDESLAGELFALVIFLSDGHMKILNERDEENSRRSKAKRFLNLATRLPMDLQMLLCNRTFGVGASVVKRAESEKGFRKFSRYK